MSGTASLRRQAEREERARQRLEKEKARTEAMSVYERRFADRGLIAGIDEVGRGPLAGPVCACALILPTDHPVLYLNDSKKLTAKKRDELYDVLKREAVSIGIGYESPEIIDEINILQATYSAMRSALAALSPGPDFLLIDAVSIPGVSVPSRSIVHGDALSVSIAAASIVAKVSRDRLMEEYDRLYPEYGFARNKGYGTAEHMAALRKYGPCPIHRKSFITHLLNG
ncbi:MAG: ribonuclease HII [Clostridiales bacterium]|uniref:ribonuclease HII n=1 Tax=Chordicoccus furentiruminis TaxID=2709410 RepID=UPI0023A86FD0|nr:ribonuclease HII [Chordicoccus furentiruminis]MCI6173188.1 ribonuclease HII [Clostridiales bacterium]